MPRSHWVIIFTLGLAVLASDAFSQEKPTTLENEPISTNRQEESTPTSDQSGIQEQPAPPNLIPSLERIEGAIRDLITEGNDEYRERQTQREINDLQAQKEMALWAFWMFVATAATVFLTFAALVAIIRTLYHTRRAADAAKDMVGQTEAATRAAEQSVAIVQGIGNAQLRAYLTVKDCVLEYHKLGQPVVKVTVVNSGQTPASNVTISGAMFIVENPSYYGVAISAGRQSKGRFGHNSSVTIEVGPVGIDQEKITAFKNQKLTMVIHGDVEYTDIFEVRWTFKYEFCAGPGFGKVKSGGKLYASKKAYEERKMDPPPTA